MSLLYIGWLVPVLFDKNYPAKNPDPFAKAFVFMFILGIGLYALYIDKYLFPTFHATELPREFIW